MSWVLKVLPLQTGHSQCVSPSPRHHPMAPPGSFIAMSCTHSQSASPRRTAQELAPLRLELGDRVHAALVTRLDAFDAEIVNLAAERKKHEQLQAHSRVISLTTCIQHAGGIVQRDGVHVAFPMSWRTPYATCPACYLNAACATLHASSAGRHRICRTTYTVTRVVQHATAAAHVSRRSGSTMRGKTTLARSAAPTPRTERARPKPSTTRARRCVRLCDIAGKRE